MFFSRPYIQADESPIGVQDLHKQGALHNGYQWVYRSPLQRLVMFKYHTGPGKEAPKGVLNNFSGTLQTDGYQVYKNMNTDGEIIYFACMAHARRYFDKALKNDKKRAEFVLKLMQDLYQIERKARDREISFETRCRYRQLYAKPILQKLEEWLIQNQLQTTPQSGIGKAIAYAKNLCPKLEAYINEGKYEIDNNLFENAIRPLALGRKNYLFCRFSQSGSTCSNDVFVFATCKINNIEPLAWLIDVLNRIPDHKANMLTELLPQNWK